MANYPETILTHLGKYRRDVLKIEESGIFTYQGRDIPKDHILAKEQMELNFLPGIRKRAKNLDDCHQRRMKWHRFAHHLNSSQVMAVNLFLPLMENSIRLGILGQVAEIGSPMMAKTGFEFIPEEGENTNIDYCVAGAGKKRLFIEVKLTEADFGRATNDAQHRTKFKALYADRCRGRILLKPGKEWAQFRLNYQFYRNALFANADTRVWFLIPGAHRSLIRRAERCLEMLDARIRPFVRIMRLEDLYDAIESRIGDDRTLVKHYAAFRRKYAPALI